jgi:hypothetical protein
MNVSLDVTASGMTARVQPALTFCPPVLMIEFESGTVAITATNEQLADLAYKLQQHLEFVGHYDEPDGDRLLAAECNAAIEAESHGISLDQRRVG